MNNICFISSTGGHYNQLLKVIENHKNGDYKVITEKNDIENNSEYYYLFQQDRKKKIFPFVIIANIFLSLHFLLKINPSVIVTTGAGAVLPFLFLAKLFGRKIVYIESFAKVKTPTITGRIVYRLRLWDEFYVQWPEMLNHYPKATYKGAIF